MNRTHRHVAIGKNGGASLFNAKEKKRAKGIWNALRSAVR